MSEDELKKWFEEICAAAPRTGETVGRPFSPAAVQFLANGQSALRAAFPQAHALCEQWSATDARLYEGNRGDQYGAFIRLVGIVDSALAQLKAGRRGSFTSIVRSAAEEDLLGVAEELLERGFRPAAAVTAGGALEVHLRGLCERQGVKWDGKNQIENYKAALEREHKANATKGLSTTDGKLVNGWGGLRNDAAHDPVKFLADRTAKDVELMIGEIRQFIARTT